MASRSPRTLRWPTDPLKEAYFGEQHIHTAYSLDAYIGGTRLTPFEAYEFARGGEVEVNGVKHKLDRPLDWVAVTDHAEYIGEMYTTFVASAPGHDLPRVKELRGLTELGAADARDVGSLSWPGLRFAIRPV